MKQSIRQYMKDAGIENAEIFFDRKGNWVAVSVNDPILDSTTDWSPDFQNFVFFTDTHVYVPWCDEQAYFLVSAPRDPEYLLGI